jgi:hypothetical protein
MSEKPLYLPAFMWCRDHKGDWSPCKIVGGRVSFSAQDADLGPAVYPKRMHASVLVTLPAADGEQACSVWWPESQLESHRGGVAPEAF